MSRKLRSQIDNVNTNSEEVEQPSKQEKPEKKKQSGGLFSLFSKKRDKEVPTRKIQDNVNVTEDTVIEQPLNSAEQKPEEEITHVNKQHGTPSRKDIKKNYSQVSMDQDVFMYMDGKYFAQVQKYYNENFDHITVVGTSAVNGLYDEFINKTSCNVIMLFILFQREVDLIHNFLKRIGLNQLDRRVLNILLIPRAGVDVSLINEDAKMKKFISTSEPIVIDKTHALTSTILDKVMCGVVQNQPMYNEPSKIVRPKRMTYKEPLMSKVYNLDISDLQSRVERLKKSSYTPELRDQISSEIVSWGNDKTGKTADDLLNEVPHMKIIQEAQKELDECISELANTPKAKKDLEDLLETRFLLANLKTAETRSMMEEVIQNANRRLEICGDVLSSMNHAALDEFNALRNDTKELIKARVKVKKDLVNKYSEYKTLVQLISNANVVTAQIGSDESSTMGKLISDNKAIIPSSELTTMTMGVKGLKLLVEESKDQKDKARIKLESALAITNNMLRDFKLLINVDDVVIDNLQRECKLLRENQTIHKYTDSKFKTIGINIFAIEDSGVDTVFRLVAGRRDLILVIGSGSQEISDTQQSLKDFMNTAWSPTETTLVININAVANNDALNNPSKVKRILDKLDYVAKFYNNIFIINRVAIDAEFAPTVFSIEATKVLSSVVYFTTLDNNKARTINMVHQSILNKVSGDTICSIRLVYNQITNELMNKRADFKKLTGVQGKGISIPYLKNIESSGDIYRDKLRLLVQHLK